ncbi:hypothetical protein APX70_00296 [Pseudomonas syringae pv. maculicola]|uniref:Uncharacterized protein n=1 Tax=Pseudomonas syringae pv. maculicola TaxID=59511 RepID=A0A3M2W6Y7_PSEYM|nr:hypothetical protein APX70_00296 [Pseudomonas syringae pv. maculicola]
MIYMIFFALTFFHFFRLILCVLMRFGKPEMAACAIHTYGYADIKLRISTGFPDDPERCDRFEEMESLRISGTRIIPLRSLKNRIKRGHLRRWAI